MVRIYPVGIIPHTFIRIEPTDGKTPQFVVHPSSAELAEQLVVDPEALKNENYSGIYDANGDYVPMYCDDPEKIPQGALPVNKPTGTQPAEPSESGGDKKEPVSVPDSNPPASE